MIEKLFEITIQGEPIAHCRPRFSRGRVYNTQTTTNFKQRVGFIIKSQYNKLVDLDSKFRIDMKFYRSNRQRVDIDNLSKSILDAITNIKLWKDDSQVNEIHAEKFTVCSEPKTEIILYRISDNSPRETCPICKKPMVNSYKSSKRKVCSRECLSKSVKKIIKVCKMCGKEFEILKCQDRYSKNFCSRICSLNFYAKLKTELRGPSHWRCQVCGGSVSRKEYKRCWGCKVLAERKDKPIPRIAVTIEEIQNEN
jgi:Holliday junction resolvase RusA-like endonuclease